MKAMTELAITPSKIVVLNIDRNPKAHICFPDYQSLCNAAAIIDSSASKGDDKCLSRGNNKTKASFNENTSVFVRNLPLNVSDDQLFEEF